MPIFHAETIIFEKRHEKIALTVIDYGKTASQRPPKPTVQNHKYLTTNTVKII